MFMKLRLVLAATWLMIGMGPVACTTPQEPHTVKPGIVDPSVPKSAIDCPPGGPGFPFDGKGSFVRTWYAKQWRALKDRGLCDEVGDAGQAWRFTFVPSFNPSVAVIIKEYKDSILMEAKRLDGAGGYEPGELVADTTFALSSEEWLHFKMLLDGSGFLTEVKTDSGVDGLDGAQWVLEWTNGAKYHVVDLWTPRADGPSAPYRRLGEWLLARSQQVSVDEVTGY